MQLYIYRDRSPPQPHEERQQGISGGNLSPPLHNGVLGAAFFRCYSGL